MKAVETLQKLIALEKSAKELGNVHEAAAAAGRIQALMTQYKLTMDDVEIALRANEEPIEWEGYTVGERRKKTMDMWRSVLADRIAKANTCAFVANKADSLFFFVGRKSDRKVCITMLAYFCDLGAKMWLEAWEQEVKNTEALLLKRYGKTMMEILALDMNKSWLKKRRHFREGFFYGFGITVAQRIEDANAAVLASVNNSTAIVHVEKDAQLVKEELKGKVKSESIKSKTQRSESGILAGSDAGLAVVLNPNVLGDSR